MFEVGFSEILLIGIVALLVLGPEKLPGAARTMGGLVRRLRNQWSNLQSEIERELHTSELKKNLDPLREFQIKQDLDESFAQLRQSVRADFAQTKRDILANDIADDLTLESSNSQTSSLDTVYTETDSSTSVYTEINTALEHNEHVESEHRLENAGEVYNQEDLFARRPNE